MNFYVDSGGAILGVDPEKIYQGSANANTIRFVGAFASNVKVTVAFKLPTGVWTTPQLMTASTQLAGVVTSNGVQFNVWEYSIPAVVTETFGTVNMQFYVYGDAGSGNGGLIATASSSFQVERGVPITLPDPTDDYETLLTQILSALSQIEGQIPEMEGDITGLQSDVTEIKEDITNLENNKLDKKQQSSSVYGVNRNGDQYNYPVMTTALPNTVMIRDENGMAGVKKGKSGDDIANMQNIADVESEVSKKYDKTGGTIDGDVQITGDLNVDGTTTTNDTETLQVKDNFIVTNADGTPLNSLSGIVIRTNANTTYAIVYDPVSDSVKLGEGTYTDGKFTFLEGEGEAVAVRDDSTAFTDKHVIVWDAAGDKFVDGGKAVSDLPTLAGNNDFTGENTFEEAIQAKKGTVVKNSLDETNYNAGYISRNDWTYLFPSDSGTFALTKNIPTDYATQTALANTQRQVDGLYTLLEQKNEIYVQTATDTYTTRETAGGENIADGVQTPVKKITGKTVKTTNLIPYPYKSTATELNGVSITINSDNSITLNGTSTDIFSFDFFSGNMKLNGSYTLSGMPASQIQNFYIQIYIDGASQKPLNVGSATYQFSNNSLTQITFNVSAAGITFNNVTIYPMLNEGSTALPYMPYFSGLKNAFFKEIVSTGRNLIPYPYADKTKTINGVTFTVNNDGTVNVNGTATDGDALFYLVSAYNLSLSYDCYFSGCPAGGSSSSYLLQAYTPASRYYSDTGSGFLLPANIDVAVVLVVRNGYTANNLVFKPILNYGSSALPYEPYTQSVLSLPEAVELTEYDTAYPETGEIQRQSNTLTFNGTETWQIYTPNEGNKQEGYTCFETILSPKSVSPENGQNSVMNNYMWSKYGYASTNSGACQSTTYLGTNIIIKQNQFNTIDEWKAHLAALSEAGNPLTVTYKTAEATTEQADFSADSYIAWKNGSETIKQGDTDNSEYGAENTVEQDYYLLTAPQEVTKE